jgi:hypothetical protein
VTDGSQVPTPSTAALLRSLAIAAAACAFLAAPAGAYVLQPFAATAPNDAPPFTELRCW